MLARCCLSSKCIVVAVYDVCCASVSYLAFLLDMLPNCFGVFGEVVASIVNYVAACLLIELGFIF